MTFTPILLQKVEGNWGIFCLHTFLISVAIFVLENPGDDNTVAAILSYIMIDHWSIGCRKLAGSCQHILFITCYYHYILIYKNMARRTFYYHNTHTHNYITPYATTWHDYRSTFVGSMENWCHLHSWAWWELGDRRNNQINLMASNHFIILVTKLLKSDPTYFLS